jgi:hypothetical protein
MFIFILFLKLILINFLKYFNGFIILFYLIKSMEWGSETINKKFFYFALFYFIFIFILLYEKQFYIVYIRTLYAFLNLRFT